MLVVQTQDLCLSFGAAPILENAKLAIETGERVCLVGRNGEGKSSLMRVLAGEIEADAGIIRRHSDAQIAYLPQDVPKDMPGTTYDVVLSGLGDVGHLLQLYQSLSASIAQDADAESLKQLEATQEKLDTNKGWDLQHRIENQLQRLEINPQTPFSNLSGGMKRQVLMARALIQKPNLLILDEPTNHLDIQAIEWLEGALKAFQGALLFVTHDRMFLRRLATRIIDLDRGTLTSWPGNYDQYQTHKQAAIETQEAEWARLDKKLAKEEAWIRQGIKARRTRNEGRVRALKALRSERKARREQTGKATIVVHEAEQTGKRVIEATNLSFGWQESTIVEKLNATIIRGDRVAIIGPNGCGKTTLVRLLLGDLPPDSGKVRLGTRLETVYFDQLRAQLDPEKTVQQNLSGGHDTVVVGGKPRHVYGYLQDFLFSPERARSPVRVLSGGERNRLLLAKLFTKEANFLVLDEPTNDLDAETLELLESVLLSFKGTLLLVSHDREFINNVVTSSLVFDEDGVVRFYAGGYDDWLEQKPKAQKKSSEYTAADEKDEQSQQKPRKITFSEQHELAALPEKIATLEAEQTDLHEKISAPDFYKNEGHQLTQINERLDVLETELQKLYDRWLTLDALK